MMLTFFVPTIFTFSTLVASFGVIAGAELDKQTILVSSIPNITGSVYPPHYKIPRRNFMKFVPNDHTFYLQQVASETSSPTTLSDEDARDLIELEWNAYSIPIWLGNFQVGKWKDDFENRKMSYDSFKYYKMVHHAGLVSITIRDKLTSSLDESFSWNDWLKLNKHGNVLNINISPTKKGLSLQRDGKPGLNDNLLTVKEGHYEISRIVRNEEIVRGSSVYRLVMGEHHAEIDTSIAKYFELRHGMTMARDRKFIVLLEYDYFDGVWMIKAGDYAIGMPSFLPTK